MDAETRVVRDRIRETVRGVAPLSRRYSPGLRSAVVACARRRLAAGASLNRVAVELGVSWRTVSGWLESTGPAPIRPVRVAAGEAACAPIVVHARGIRIERLDVAGLSALIRALS